MVNVYTIFGKSHRGSSVTWIDHRSTQSEKNVVFREVRVYRENFVKCKKKNFEWKFHTHEKNSSASLRENFMNIKKVICNLFKVDKKVSSHPFFHACQRINNFKYNCLKRLKYAS